MADFINNVAAADQYSNPLTLGPDYVAKNAVITVANNPVLMQFAIGKLGAWRWTDEREYFSIPQSFRVGRVIGVKFRNANPGAIARVLATLSGEDDPDFESGIPFTGTLTAAGGIQSGQSMTGRISAAGAILAGTGFTVNRTGVGVYVVTYTTPFSATPVVVVTPNDFISNLAWGTTANGPGGFTANFGGPVDHDFNFTATPIQ